jgi:elongator complex protein 3
MSKDLQAQSKEWHDLKKITPEKEELALLALEDIRNGAEVFEALRKHPIRSVGGGFIGKQMLVNIYRKLVAEGELEPDPELMARIRMKPTRSQSGVTVVTVLTKPYPCPGECIFCPTDWRMPKSYLPDEPGAMRALHHDFDPHDQITSRLQALDAVGHPTDKIELIILGGTFSHYQREYQEWFVHQCFNAMNKVDLPTLADAQKYNETTEHRCVGLVLETRPDQVTPDELDWMRYLGATKVQMGAQSFNNRILELNKRGHSAEEIFTATQLLRAGAFKIVLHWMPNLLGATVRSDKEDFAKMWQGSNPDEIKIYPTQLLENSDLFKVWQEGKFHPYTTRELIDLIVNIKPSIPRYCRVNRIVRDIPSDHVVEGNKRTSLRMDIHNELVEKGLVCKCVRCREIRGDAVSDGALSFNDLEYQAGTFTEHFLSFDTPDDKLAGFLRLSLPHPDCPDTGLSDLQDAALIREIHIYGQSIEVGGSKTGAAQHIGLGKKLLLAAEQTARDNGFKKIAVISAVGTRRYYANRGFTLGTRYMVKNL